MQIFFRKTNRAFTRTPKFGVTPKGGGFTLVETLVSVSIFSMSILGLLTILSQGISDTGYAKKKIIASYLAQEGIEYIRNMRDTFVLFSATSQAGWNAFNTKVAENTYPSGSTLCASANGCYFDDRNVSFIDISMPITDLLLTLCTSSNCSNGPLLYDSATGKYGYVASGTTTSSGFTRKIKIIQINANETKVFSTVYWTQGSGTYNIVLAENLFNWVE
ncbi:MAG: prepilin-type N-terminal cleavage/methylation domain-containing protein [Candidatus Paceibacterota bacterium]